MSSLQKRTMKNIIPIIACFASTSLGQTIENPDPAAVTGRDAVRRLLSLAGTRRIDFGLIADSNGRLGAAATGHEDSQGRAWAARFGTYATRIDPPGSTTSWGQLTQDSVSYNFAPFGGAVPSYVQPFVHPFDNFPCFPGLPSILEEGVHVVSYYNAGMQLYQTCPLNINNALRYHLTHYVTDTATGGYINPSAREGYPGNLFHSYAVSPTIATTGATPHIEDIVMNVPAGQRHTAGIMFCNVNATNDLGANGPVALMYQRVEDVNQATGISYSPLWEQGGKSSRYTLFTLQTANVETSVKEWYRQVGRLQNGDPVLCIHIMHGGNDCNDYENSLGPIGGFSSTSLEGFKDNIQGIINITRNWWIEKGNDPSNLFYMVGPYHPRPGTDNDLQLGFEQAGRDLANADTQVIAIAGNKLSTPAEFAANGYLLGGNDINHLSSTGFHKWAATTIRVLDLAICPSDFNNDHTATVTDIFAFLNAWFAGLPTGDFNHSGESNIQDIFDFLSSWFMGC
jgi:hypothetical protein